MSFSTPAQDVAIAKSHLDFWAPTEHCIGQPANEERFPNYWNELRPVLAENNEPGSFVTIAGCEWGLPGCGDMNIYFPDDGPEQVQVPRSFDQCAEYVRSLNGILVPHHTAYMGSPPASYNEEYGPGEADAFRAAYCPRNQLATLHPRTHAGGGDLLHARIQRT